MFLEAAHQPGELAVPPVGLSLGGAGDDQRGAGLVDEDRVHLVDDRVVVLTLHELVEGPGHVVAEEVEAELVVRAVGDVRGVLLAAYGRGLARHDDARLHAEEAEHAAHEVGLVGGEEVVDRHHVHAPAGQRVEVGRSGGHEGLALAGLHLRDVALVQRDAAEQLDVVVPLAERASRGLADRGEGLRQEQVQRLAVRMPGPERVRLGTQLRIAERPEVILEEVHGVHRGLHALEDAVVRDLQDAVDDRRHWFSAPLRCGRGGTGCPSRAAVARSPGQCTGLSLIHI